MSILIVCMLLIVLAVLWVCRAMEKAADQRIALLESIPNAEWWTLYPLFLAVDYKKHLLRVMTLRDPWPLYPWPLIASLPSDRP